MMLTVGVARRVPRWLVLAFVITVSLVPAAAGTSRLVELARGAVITAANARFFVAPLPVVLHIVAVIPFSILGALQLAPTFRKRYPQWHRRVGRPLVVAALVCAVTGLWMTLTYPWPQGDGVALYNMRLVVGSAMLMFIAMSIGAIVKRDFRAHGRWMLRAYAIGMGAATQVLTHVPWFILFGTPSEDTRALLMGAGWVINAVIAELVIRESTQVATVSHTRLVSS